MPEGIPNLPDLTHPQELMQWGQQVMLLFLVFIVLVGFLGFVLAALTWANRNPTTSETSFTDQWMARYSQILRILQHGSLVLAIVIGGFFLCSTLANRYHYWEQARVSKIAETVAGDRLEQAAPLVRYEIE